MKKPKVEVAAVDARRSERARKVVFYGEEPAIKQQRTPVDYSERIKVSSHLSPSLCMFGRT